MNSKETTSKLRMLRLAREEKERASAKVLKAAKQSLMDARREAILEVVRVSLGNGTFHENDLPNLLAALKNNSGK
jgi:hypothetical protein